jgi:Mg2+ and Co2+ transporter CorA
MRIFSVHGSHIIEAPIRSPVPILDDLRLPEIGYLWITCTRPEFDDLQDQIQAMLQKLCALQLVDLHVSDLLNAQLPSRYDYTSQYDLLVFRRLATRSAEDSDPINSGLAISRRGGPPILRRIDTGPVGFVVLDRVLLSVHPQDRGVIDNYADRLLASADQSGQDDPASDSRSTGARGIPANPADLMLRVINHMVDGFLALRRELNSQLDHWQAELLNPKTRFNNWAALLNARLALHQLDEICEDQHSAIQDWLEALKAWPENDNFLDQHARDMLQVRSRDVMEHIERMVHHVRRLEQNTETAVQMHFNAQSHRTNEIMRTLTVLTAIFLPLNLIAGIFGMNFEFIPLLHQSNGFWMAMVAMAVIASSLVAFFWRKRYLDG